MSFATPVEPCCAPNCANPLGGKRDHNDRPMRISGVKFGLDGWICKACYGLHYNRFRDRQERERRKAAGQPPRATEWGRAQRGDGRHHPDRSAGLDRRYTTPYVPKPVPLEPDPAAVATIARLHEERARVEALGEPRRPCVGGKPGHRLIAQAGLAAPLFVCADCSWRWVPPADPSGKGAKWPKRRELAAH